MDAELKDATALFGKDLVAAEQRLRDLLAVRESARKPDPGRVVAVQTVLWMVEMALDRPEEALRLVDAARSLVESDRRPPLNRVLGLRSMAATTHLLCGRFALAEAELADVAKLYGACSAPTPSTVKAYFASRIVYSRLLSAQARFGEAVAFVDDLVPRLVMVLGAQHKLVYRTLLLRADVLAVLGRYEQAESECRALLAVRPGSVPEVERAGSACGLAYCLVETGRAAEAETVLRDLLAPSERDHPTGPVTTTLRRELANALSRQGRYEEALALVEAAPTRALDAPGRHCFQRATALHGLGRRTEAEAAAEEALVAARAALAPAHIAVLEIRTVLARIRDTPEEWAPVTADWLTHYGPDHPRTRAAADH
ncbi:tetratricopeptide repeat protein [Streptomyces sp. NRRL F-5123]|uniref:tetratricopeptide repeat protein n=1 Tax=Streptomyces sp. NRRL F-5123 TaxID=1463856 RepID=UPI00131A9BD4|nr:tetratricopeptide repeat protein [Streptomyces sp. NRRL F-5123]